MEKHGKVHFGKLRKIFGENDFFQTFLIYKKLNLSESNFSSIFGIILNQKSTETFYSDKFLAPFHVGRITAGLIGAPTLFTVTAFTKSQNLFSPSFELFLRKNNGFYASLFYNAQIGSGFWSNQAALTLGSFF